MEELGGNIKCRRTNQLVCRDDTNGDVRFCVDLTKLNDNVYRENHSLPVVDQILMQPTGAQLFRCQFRVLADPVGS